MSMELDLLLQREEYGLRVPRNKALKEDKEEYGRELHDENVHNLCTSYILLLRRSNQEEQHMRY